MKDISRLKDKLPMYSFIPKQLRVENRPELANFPLNVMHLEFRNYQGDLVQIMDIVYEPDLSSFSENGHIQSMCYYWPRERQHWIKIERNKVTGHYTGYRYKGDTIVTKSEGPEWHGFFIHFTMPIV